MDAGNLTFSVNLTQYKYEDKNSNMVLFAFSLCKFKISLFFRFTNKNVPYFSSWRSRWLHSIDRGCDTRNITQVVLHRFFLLIKSSLFSKVHRMYKNNFQWSEVSYKRTKIFGRTSRGCLSTEL